MAAALPSGTVTFLFTDIEGSTRLLQQLGEGYAHVRADHHRLLRKAFADHGGVEVDTAGDSFFVAFPLAPAAVAAAAAATRALAAHPWPEGSTLRVRMGLHTGTGTLYEGHYIGLDVHQAARIAAAGHGGQILLSASTRELAANALPQGATLRDLGQYQLKDLPQPERIYQLVLAGLPAEFPPLKTLDRPPYQLPPRAPGFVGREQDQEALTTALRDDQAVAVVGMGGLGKSSVAAEVVHTLAADPTAFPGGVAWVRCDERAGLEGLCWILDQVLAAWGVTLSADALRGAATPEEGLAIRERALRQRLSRQEDAPPPSALVLFDNVEAALPLHRMLETILPLGITPLLTMRAESTTPALRLLHLEVLPADAAIALFAGRYRDRGGAWDSVQDEPVARQIVETLGYLPLAIELAAARAARTHMALSALAADLAAPDALARLTDPLDRSAGVRYSLGKTLSALSPEQRVRFAALGLPDGPDWPVPVVEQMLAAVPPDAVATVSPAADLEALAAYSLVSFVAGVDGQRIRLHPLVRDLAREELGQQPETVQQAALAGLLAGVNALVSAHPLEMDLLAPDEDLIVGAIRTAAARQVELPIIYNLISDTFDSYLLFRTIALRKELDLLMLRLAREHADRSSELAALARLANTYSFLGEREATLHAVSEALDLAQAVGEPLQALYVLTNVVDDEVEQGKLTEAWQTFTQAQAIVRAMGDTAHSGAYFNLGTIASTVGALAESKVYFERALALARASGNKENEGVTLHYLGDLATQMGDDATARTYHEQSLVISRAAGATFGIGNELDRLGEIEVRAGNLAAAQADFEEALQAYTSIQYTQMIVHTRGNLLVVAGETARLRGESEEAIRHYEAALAVFGSVPKPGSHSLRVYSTFAQERLSALRQSASDSATPAGAGAVAVPRGKRSWLPWRRSKGMSA